MNWRGVPSSSVILSLHTKKRSSVLGMDGINWTELNTMTSMIRICFLQFLADNVTNLKHTFRKPQIQLRENFRDCMLVLPRSRWVVCGNALDSESVVLCQHPPMKTIYSPRLLHCNVLYIECWHVVGLFSRIRLVKALWLHAGEPLTEQLFVGWFGKIFVGIMKSSLALILDWYLFFLISILSTWIFSV